MKFDIQNHTVFLTLHGSHAYGMARPESDIDLKGIAIPPIGYFMGFNSRFEQYESEFPFNKEQKEKLASLVKRKLHPNEKMDSTIYDVRKFFHLAAQCNPNIIEVLFTDEDIHLISHPVMREILSARDLFISTRANFRFRGYAFSQLKRIKRHRKWLLNPPQKKPEREDYGLPLRTVIGADQLLAAESLIKKKVDEWVFENEEMHPELLSAVRNKTTESFKEIFSGMGITNVVNEFEEFDRDTLSSAAGKLLGYSDNFLDLLDRERRYKSAITAYKQYKNWEKSRNPARAELEKKYGYDTKHASHLVRLMRMAEEIITNGTVNVCRNDAKELLEVRNGAWSYDSLIEWAENQDEKIQNIYDSGVSPLPKKPNMNKLDQLCIKVVEMFYEN